MTTINIQEIGNFISTLEADKLINPVTPWGLWLEENPTKLFLDYIVARRIEIQQEITDITLDSQENIVFAIEKKGSFVELGRIIELFNKYLDKDTHDLEK